MFTRILFSLLLAATVAAFGCGDISSKSASNSSTGEGVSFVNNGVQPGPGTGTGNFSFGVDSSSTAAELSATEIDTACGRFEAHLTNRFGAEQLESLSCTLMGYFAARNSQDDPSAQQACVETRDRCLQNPEPIDIGCPMQDAEGCSVTIAEIEHCTNLQIDFIGDVVRSLSCDDATTDQAALDELEQQFPECAALDDCGDVIVEETEPVPPPGG